jgi:hypothetical protein
MVADLAHLEVKGNPIDPSGAGGVLIGYARVSTRDQKLHLPIGALIAVRCRQIGVVEPRIRRHRSPSCSASAGRRSTSTSLN